MKHVLALAFSVAALLSCANAVTPSRDAPHPSDACILLQQGGDAMTSTAQLTEAQRATLRAIQTERLEPPSYRCGDVSYPTDPRQRGLTFTGIGFSTDRHFARLSLQQVAGPLAGGGHSCLYEAEDQSWELRGCEMDWIS